MTGSRLLTFLVSIACDRLVVDAVRFGVRPKEANDMGQIVLERFSLGVGEARRASEKPERSGVSWAEEMSESEVAEVALVSR
jgi:hypothetical protein